MAELLALKELANDQECHDVMESERDPTGHSVGCKEESFLVKLGKGSSHCTPGITVLHDQNQGILSSHRLAPVRDFPINLGGEH